ncbi:hypothetical protein ACH415_33640 [Streptomyces californicus]|uniref:hypothetical protein n=1 Tax=Streptomyces TaxID=1883 RepID=UPI0006ADE21A|nr:hypothetical protein [Streptomyces sp. MMG1522]KOU45103.1 hypothetical protein ADK56_34160 [Streptomyces sp. MMG1522]
MSETPPEEPPKEPTTVPFGMPSTWEDILGMFHDGVTKLPDRNAVAGPGSKRWIVRTCDGVWHDEKGVDYAEDRGLDAFFEFWYPGDSNARGDALIFGFGYNWGEFGNDSGALAEFTGATAPILSSVRTGKNKDANPLLSEKAATVLNHMDDWTDGWANQFNTWAESVESGNDQLRGESAEIFAATLQAVKRSLQETYSFYLSDGILNKRLSAASTQLSNTITQLQKNADAWFDKTMPVGTMSGGAAVEQGSVAMAFTHLYAQFLAVMNTFKPPSNFHNQSEKPNWDDIEAKAKTSWITEVETELDAKSVGTMAALAGAYDAATLAFLKANAIVNKTFTISLTADEQKEFYGSAGPGGGGDGGTGGTNDILNKFREMFGGGAGGSGGSGAGGGGNEDLDLDTPPPVTGPSGSSFGANLPSGANLPNTKDLLKQNPVTGPSGGGGGTTGNPLSLPAGSRIDPKTGAVTDSSGKPVTGPDGKPLVVPPGSTLGPGNSIVPPKSNVPKVTTPPNGSSGGLTGGLRVDSNGNIIVPKGVKVDAQGNLIGADGKPLTNAYGGKITVPPGSRINPDGTITDPQGKQITQGSGSLKTRNPFSVDDLVNSQRRTSTASGDLFGISKGGSNDLLGGSKGLTDGLRKSFEGPGGGGREPIGGAAGLSNRARLAMGLPAAPTAPTQGGLVTQSGNVLGRAGAPGATGSGMPFMPPMGMGGGAPGGGSGSGNDRQRNVWLSEDEEVWGTEPEAGTGVIGR